ncbi:hypothetical protein G7069_07050 [Lysobacter sp. HDW10]|uniref:hypothetical protein n=1 Tax=Lysobacter sp. HDW10 TaxID=2714936 RepID=UPI00140D6F65|nr:hypothetical protein [Lysobacter sp. HDW10]QIK81377.1 hypothetical protein G7069_07050 [Lysobacter sp. HDW10]
MDTLSAPRTATFRLVAVLALAWNLIGLAMFWMQMNMTPEQLAELTEGQRKVNALMPQWLWWIDGIAVGTGVIASILLIMRKRLSVAFFMISLVAIVVLFSSGMVITDMIQNVGATEALTMPITVTVIAIALLWYARRANAKGWLS